MIACVHWGRVDAWPDDADGPSCFDWLLRQQFDLFVFQFPNVGSRNPLYGRNTDHIPVRRFVRSATEYLTGKGNVAMSAVNSPHHDGACDVDGAAQRNLYEIPVAYPFYFPIVRAILMSRRRMMVQAPSARAVRS
jgi:hypothetical protein